MSKQENPILYTIEKVPVVYGGITLEMAERALKGELYVPTFGFVRPVDPDNFELQIENPDNTKQLWHHTLPSVLALLKAGEERQENHFFERALDITEKYLRWLAAQPLAHPAWKDEHAVANRLRLLNYYLSMQDQGQMALTPAFARSAAAMAQSHAAWCANENTYVWNNHGLMSDRALLEAAVVQTHVPLWQRNGWAEMALNRARKLLEKTFDSRGCCTENSPGYHLLNMMLFKDFANFCRQVGYDAELEVFAERLALAETFAGLFVRIDGTYATIGDTELNPTQWIDSVRYAPITGTAVSPESGFFIHKSGDLYLTAKCGGSTFAHRHVDETSITLQYKGIDFIVDAGLYNFSTLTDRQARWFRSARAHSGVFTEDCDDVRFARFSGPKQLGSLSEIRLEGDDIHVEMESLLSKSARITRAVTIFPGKGIRIMDHVQSYEDEMVGWRIAFLIPGEAKIRNEGGTYRIRCGAESIEISFSPSAEASVRKTFMSRRFGLLEDAHALVVSGRDVSKILETYIDFGCSLASADAG